MAAGSLSLGGNLSIALGPLGRNGEASGSVNTKGKVAAMLVLQWLNLFYHLTILIGTVTRKHGDFSAASRWKAP